jgi:putative flippase GtrA
LKPQTHLILSDIYCTLVLDGQRIAEKTLFMGFDLRAKKTTVRTQFVLFLLVGGFSTALHYIILIVLVQSDLSGPLIASAIGFTSSAIFNYILNRQLTFRSTRPHAQAAPRFALVALTGLGINTVLLWLFHGPGAQHYIIAQLLATIGTIFWNFVLNRLWTFCKISQESQPEMRV